MAAVAAALCTPLEGDADKQERPSGACCAVLRSTGGGNLSLKLAAAGVRQYGSDNLVCEADVWHLGSCGKAITATLAAVLISQGKIPGGYDATVEQVLSSPAPGCGIAPPTGFDSAYGSVTLGQLLSHTGLCPGAPPGNSWDVAWQLHFSNSPGKTASQQRSGFLSAAMKDAPTLQPGTYEYSNQGYTLAGHMLELATGVEYETLLLDYLFRPLGMASAGIGSAGAPDCLGTKMSDASVQGFPWGHGEQSNWCPKDPREAGSDNPSPITPAGRIHANMADWAAFIAVHIDKEAAQNMLGIDPEAFEAMHAKHEPSTDSYCSAGFIVAPRGWQRGNLCLTHAGSNTLNYCSVWATEGVASLITTNHGGCANAVDAAQGTLIGMF